MERNKEYVEAMQRIVKERNIRCLYHYTQLMNLDSILWSGILSKAWMRRQGVAFAENDPDRFDGELDGISVSVGFPNFKTFYTKRKQMENDPSVHGWAVLALKPDLLWELPCSFQWANAASREMIAVPLEERRTAEAFGRMFADLPDHPRSGLISPWQTTDPQAEVLVFGEIPREYILYANVESEDVKNSPYIPDAWRDDLKVYPKLFQPREDWQEWR